MRPKIIGITGYIGSGKTLLADALCSKHNFTKVKMAYPIKKMLSSVGLSYSHLEGMNKEIETELLCNKTPRFAMQTLGTEWGRKIMGDNIWVNLWSTKVSELTSMNQGVVADDVRFLNEAKIIRDMGGVIVRMERPSSTKTNHESEDQNFDADLVIENNDTIEKIFNSIPKILQL